MLALTNDRLPQRFPLEAPKTAEWFVLKNLIQAEGPFPALTQIEAWGREADADK
ncbi:MAG TPA: hypothetical protein H9945_02860 [Candidatus Gemmiger avicola]|uniref:Uncharacterized protein n=1 Tax=Candidatus Gemmiger avicola TaxID=2838605 RepID=A0A9D2M693_9FIRM|nr:hypothetical protein [Candidatus Gemmiger avicola]